MAAEADATSVTGPATVVRSRPVAVRLIAQVIGLALIGFFLFLAVILPSTSDGVTFHLRDQLAVAGFGFALAGLFWLPTRPRLSADAEGVRVRGILGDHKLVPWSLVRSVEFRPKWKWGRLILPADESISLYAVQRWDGDRSVTVMRRLRELHAAAQEQAPPPGPQLSGP
jgi:hypothetical protein